MHWWKTTPVKPRLANRGYRAAPMTQITKSATGVANVDELA
jgi:hypothetical protein